MKIVAFLCMVFVYSVLCVQCRTVLPLNEGGLSFKIDDVIDRSTNPDGSTTYTCRYAPLNVQGKLTIMLEKNHYIRVIQSDGICKVNDCNMPPMRNMLFNMKTEFNPMCQLKNTNEVTLSGDKKTCVWLNNDCNKSPTCKPSNLNGNVTDLPDHVVKVNLKCSQIDAEFFCNKTLPNVWMVATNDKHRQYRVIKRIQCQTVVPLSMSMTPCRKIKKVKHSHYTIKNRVVTYTCKDGYQQKGRVNQYTCDSYSGKWNNVNMKCKKIEKSKKLSILEIVLMVLGIIAFLIIAAVIIICKCICEGPFICCW